MSEEINISGMRNAEDKLEGSNCPMSPYTMRDVLAAKLQRSDDRQTSKLFSKLSFPFKNNWLKCYIVPRIWFCTISKGDWDVLNNLYAQRNEPRVVMLKQQLEETKMQEGDSMDAFMTKIKDFKEQLLNIDKVIFDKQLASKVLAALPYSF